MMALLGKRNYSKLLNDRTPCKIVFMVGRRCFAETSCWRKIAYLSNFYFDVGLPKLT
jgi:hypothetical protein